MNNNHWEKGKRSIFAFREEKRGKTLGRFYSIFGSMFVLCCWGCVHKDKWFLGKDLGTGLKLWKMVLDELFT